MIKPYRIDVPQEVVTDLKQRLSVTRWPDEVANKDWESGTDLKYLRELCAYWQHDFDWYRQQELLNGFAHFQDTIDGLEIHFIHEKGRGTTNIPLLLTHGWPDSIFRFYKLIPLLTEPDERGIAFDVVAPSIPGFGFSGKPTEAGMNPKQIARMFNELMTSSLGYKQYAAHGGDWGSTITEHIALYHADNLSGILLTDVPFIHGLKPPEDLSPAEQKFVKKRAAWDQKEGGYMRIQGSKPQTLSYGLNDSPAGLAGWIIEKFHAWSDDEGNLESVYTKDELLTNIMIYWVTQTANSSIRIYYETMKQMMDAQFNPLTKLNPFEKTGDRAKVRAGFAIFPKDIGQPPREWAERFFDVQQFNEMSAGGHFAALEQPELLAKELRTFFVPAVS